jgi:hypothetical protein
MCIYIYIIHIYIYHIYIHYVIYIYIQHILIGSPISQGDLPLFHPSAPIKVGRWGLDQHFVAELVMHRPRGSPREGRDEQRAAEGQGWGNDAPEDDTRPGRLGVDWICEKPFETNGFSWIWMLDLRWFRTIDLRHMGKSPRNGMIDDILIGI